MSSIVPPCDGTDTSGSHSPATAIASNDTATSVALKLSCNGIPALMMEFGANVGTRVPIGDVDMVYFFVKVNVYCISVNPSGLNIPGVMDWYVYLSNE